MGFFDELGSFVGEFTSIGDDLKQSADEVVQNISESTEELTAIKDELVDNVQSATDSIDNTLNKN